MSAQEVAALKYPAPFWPYGQIITVAFMVGVVVLLAFSDSTRIALLVGGVWLALMTCVYYLWLRPRARRAAVADTAPHVVCGEGQGLSDEQDSRSGLEPVHQRQRRQQGPAEPRERRFRRPFRVVPRPPAQL
ncbi:hypothetical protein ABZS88_28880 [Streptomyces sp. NPDC005480]|uniref:hypothetical protein n=1 Tax=Streptomyces sp. NPDC005480 TaxID=3154880 RepID=UPI0033AB218F